ncbi:hypothetical protein JW977_04945 [Candidatus Falkowbacteria bacterium]|nr:hypothetical protein [Candidatus Falkowbacteria bacterium]
MYISYKNILHKAGQITWHNKILWLMGIFASFISMEGVYEIILSQINKARNIEALYIEVANAYLNQISFIHTNVYFLNWLPKSYSAFLMFILLGLFLVIFIYLAYLSQIFIIKSAALIYRNNKLVSGKVLAESVKKFWPVFGLNILAKLILYAAFIGLSLPIFYTLIAGSQNILNAADIFYFLAFACVAILISFLTAYATNFIVLKNCHLIEAIKDAYHLFTKNIIVSLEIALILFLLKILSLIIIFSLFFLLLVPLSVLLFMFLAYNSLLGLIIVLILMIFAFTLCSLLINAIFTTFYLSSWTIAFIKMTEETIFAKIVDFISGLPNIFNKTINKYDLKIDKEQLQTKAADLGQKIQKAYKEYEPELKKQSKIAAKKVTKAYHEFEPIIEKEIKKIITPPKQIKAKKTIKSKYAKKRK